LAIGLAMELTPIGLAVAGIAALVYIIYQLATHWSEVTGAIKSGASEIGNFIGGIGDAILAFFQAIVDAVMAPFNAINSAYQSISSTISNIASPSFAAAEGGIVTRPAVGLVGEAGPEAIIPLSQLGSLGGGGGDTHVYVTNAVVGNEQQIARAVTKALKTVRTRGGGFYT
jgi:phage-related minor tail protein